MALTVVNQPVGKELGSPLHQRIGLFPQEGFVLRELVVFPQMAREPALHHRPEGGTGHVIVGYGLAPQGGVVMGHPTTGSVHALRRLATRYGQFLNHTEQRFVAFGQIGQLGRPVVHFSIDVDGIAAVPGRDGILVPDALQVEGLAAGTRTGYHKVAAVLEEGGSQVGVALVGKAVDTLVGRQGQLLGRGSQLQADATEEGVEVGRMPFLQLVVSIGRSLLQDGRGLGRRVNALAAGALVETVVAGGHAQKEAGFVRAAHADTLVGDFDLATAAHGQELGLEEHALAVYLVAIEHALVELAAAVGVVQLWVLVLVAPALQLLEGAPLHVARCLTFQHQLAVLLELVCGGMNGCEVQRDVEPFLVVGLQADDDDIVGMRSEDFALHRRAARGIDGAVHGLREVQLTGVGRSLAATIVRDVEVAEGLVVLVQTSQPVLADEVRSLAVFASFHQGHDAFLHGRRHLYVLEHRRGFAAVECVFVELQVFLGRSAEDHRSQPAVADGQSLVPVGRRLVVPQPDGLSLLFATARAGRQAEQK